MRIQSLQEMLIAYENNLDADDRDLRVELLSKFKYSVIVEGEYSEFTNLFKWIEINIGENAVKDIFYGKTDYDFGFAEFFLNGKDNEKKLIEAVPRIYTVYPNAYPVKRICRSNGPGTDINYDPADGTAILC